MVDGSKPLAGGMPLRAASSARVMLWTLLLVYTLNFLDRQIIGILAESIKTEFRLQDWHIGLMTGPAFAVLYAVLGVPIARHADKGSTNRVRLMSACLAIWSVMTALCGAAQSFGQMLLARIGVGIGEAGCTPTAHSLISDTVAPEKRSSAIAFFGLGIPVGSMLGLVIGGVVSDLYGWRTALLMAAAPGLLLAVALPLLIREPRHSSGGAGPGAASGGGGFGHFLTGLSEIFSSRAFTFVFVAASLTAFLSYGKGVWILILFQRSHGFSAGETGLLLGLVLGVAGLLGTWLGGQIADRFGKRDKRYVLLLPAIGMVIATPILFFGYAATDWRVAILLLFLPTALNAAYYGPAYSCVQGLVRPQARAVAASMVVFGQNLIGLGLGPLAFGALSDALMPLAGAESVRWVLFGAAWLGIIPAFFFWRASLRLGAELKSG